MAPQQQAMQANGRQQQRSGAGHPGSSQAYPGVSTQGLEDIGYGEQAAQIQTETQQQDRYLDEISKGLDQLKFGAQVRFEQTGWPLGGIRNRVGLADGAALLFWQSGQAP